MTVCFSNTIALKLRREIAFPFTHTCTNIYAYINQNKHNTNKLMKYKEREKRDKILERDKR